MQRDGARGDSTPGTAASAAARKAERWLGSGLFDAEFYAAVRGREFADEASAALDLVVTGMPEQLSCHPFLDLASLPRSARVAWGRGKVGAVLDQLTVGGRPRPVGPLAEAEDRGAAREHMLDVARRLHRPPDPTPDVDWDRIRAEVSERDDTVTSVVVVTDRDAVNTMRAVASVLDRADESGESVDVVLVDRASAVHVALGLQAAFWEVPRVSLRRLSTDVSPARARNLGFAQTRGGVVVFLDRTTHVRRGWLRPLRELLGDPEVAGAQPLLLHPDDTIRSAGTACLRAGHPAVALLEGHQKEDALRLQGEPLAAMSPGALALRAEDVVDRRGFTDGDDAVAVLDLCRRILAVRPGGFRLAPTALVTQHGSGPFQGAVRPDAGLQPRPDPDLLDRIGFTADCDVEGRPAITGRTRTGADQLRWSVKLPSTRGHWGDDWGDTHFADALARALRDLGDEVVTARRGAHAAGPTHLDDVSLAIRGMYPITAPSAPVNVLWVISHPDQVDPTELDGYDLVFAASTRWSRLMSERTGREVLPLLQATEFEPRPGARTAERRAVFVGNNQDDRERPLVLMAAEAGLPLAVFGRGWEGILPEGSWLGEYLPNDRLPELYARCGVVLADHWPAMAEHGFIANRVFDAVACGARVLCDDVRGIEDVFDPSQVMVCRSVDDLRRGFERTATLGRQPRTTLDFNDRARVLHDQVLRVRGQAGRRGLPRAEHSG